MFIIKLSRKALRDLKFLKKKFQKIEDDLDELFSIISKENLVGNQIKNLSGFEIYKARVRNTSSSTGNSGGFRIIYYARRKCGEILVLAIYSKTQKSDISRSEILEILKEENFL